MTALAKAMAAFAANECDRTAMDVPAWAETYNVEVEEVRAAFEAALTRHSRQNHRNGEDHE